jgi:hypothetical protein
MEGGKPLVAAAPVATAAQAVVAINAAAEPRRRKVDLITVEWYAERLAAARSKATTSASHVAAHRDQQPSARLSVCLDKMLAVSLD